MAPLEELAGEIDGRRTGADKQQPLAGTHASADPFERQPPADDDGCQQDGGNEEHAAAHHQARHPEVQNRKREGR